MPDNIYISKDLSMRNRNIKKNADYVMKHYSHQSSNHMKQLLNVMSSVGTQCLKIIREY